MTNIQSIRQQLEPIGSWNILAYAGKTGPHSFAWAKCVCGEVRKVRWDAIRRSKNPSCGCLNKNSRTTIEFHGASKTKEYSSWQAMLKRASVVHSCGDDKISQVRYRDRGIAVCDEWVKSFSAFLAHIGPMPVGCQMTLDRVDNDKGYEPGNVRWATRKQQAQNSSWNRNITVGDKTMCLQEWARATGINRPTISQRLRAGWDEIRAVTQPTRENKRHKETTNENA